MNNLNIIPSNGTFGNAIDKISINFQILQIAITYLQNIAMGGGKIYATLTDLQSAYPNPKSGNWGYVNSNLSFPATIYTYNGSSWIMGGQGNGGDSAENINAALSTALTSLSNKTSESINDIIVQASKYLPVREDGFYFTDTAGNVVTKITNNGLDASKLGDNIINLIKQIEGIGLILGETSSTAYAGDKGKKDANDIKSLQAAMAGVQSIAEIDEDGFVVCDQNGYTIFRVDENGYDFANISSHAISVLKNAGIGALNYEIIETIN